MALSEKASEFLSEDFLMRWADHTLEDVRANFDRRGVFPYGMPGPYAQFRQLNQKRKAKKKWHSTGMGVQQMYARVWRSANGDQAKVTFFFTRYLNLMDMGVGRGRPITNVSERSKDAKWNQKFADWGTPSDSMSARDRARRKKGEQSRRSRPALLIEFRHQITKLKTLVASQIGELIDAAGFSDTTNDLRYSDANGIHIQLHD